MFSVKNTVSPETKENLAPTPNGPLIDNLESPAESSMFNDSAFSIEEPSISKFLKSFTLLSLLSFIVKKGVTAPACVISKLNEPSIEPAVASSILATIAAYSNVPGLKSSGALKPI